MIDWLRAAKSAHFYKKRKRIPKAAIEELFRSIRERSDAATHLVVERVDLAGHGFGFDGWS